VDPARSFEEKLVSHHCLILLLFSVSQTAKFGGERTAWVVRGDRALSSSLDKEFAPKTDWPGVSSPGAGGTREVHLPIGFLAGGVCATKTWERESTAPAWAKSVIGERSLCPCKDRVYAAVPPHLYNTRRTRERREQRTPTLVTTPPCPLPQTRQR
jgi:hypothetical protein